MGKLSNSFQLCHRLCLLNLTLTHTHIFDFEPGTQNWTFLPLHTNTQKTYTYLFFFTISTNLCNGFLPKYLTSHPVLLLLPRICGAHLSIPTTLIQQSSLLDYSFADLRCWYHKDLLRFPSCTNLFKQSLNVVRKKSNLLPSFNTQDSWGHLGGSVG